MRVGMLVLPCGATGPAPKGSEGARRNEGWRLTENVSPSVSLREPAPPLCGASTSKLSISSDF